MALQDKSCPPSSALLAELVQHEDGSELIAKRHELSLKISQLSTKGAFNLAGVLETNRHVRKLDLSSSGLTASVARMLGKALGRDSLLSTLDVSYNAGLGSDGVAVIIGNVGSAVTHLDCSACGVNDSRVWAIANALSMNKHLRIFSLASNAITVRGARILATGPDPEQENCNHLGGLTTNASLTTLDLGRNSLGGEGVAVIIEYSKLATLDCSYCNVLDAGTPVVAGALRSSAHLRALSLRANDITSWSAQPLGAALSRNTVLTSLDLSFNTNLGSSGIAHLLQQSTFALKELHCLKCGLGNTGEWSVADALKTNYYLSRLLADGVEGTPSVQPILRRNFLINECHTWADALESLLDVTILVALLRCIANHHLDAHPAGDVVLMHQELKQDIAKAGALESMSLLEALLCCAQSKLENLLAPAPDRKDKAAEIIEKHAFHPLCPKHGLTRMWELFRTSNYTTS